MIPVISRQLLNLLPRVERSPQAAQMTRLNPTDPVPSNTPLGEMNTPEPEMRKQLFHIIKPAY